MQLINKFRTTLLKGHTNGKLRQKDAQQCVFLLMFVCVLVPADIIQLSCMFIAMLCFWFTQSSRGQFFSNRSGKCSQHISKQTADRKEEVSINGRSGGCDIFGEIVAGDEHPGARIAARARNVNMPARLPKPMMINPDVMTCTQLQAPITGRGWDADVDELVQWLTPTAANDLALKNLGAIIKHGVSKIFPNADVHTFMLSNYEHAHASSYEVPDIDIVLHVDDDALFRRMQEHSVNSQTLLRLREEGKLEMARLCKSALRECTERLSWNGFKFSRSSFRGYYPKVTMMTSQKHGIGCAAFDFSVNSMLRWYIQDLAASCSDMDPRVGPLILLVRRWANARRLAFAPRGHFPPYLWLLLTVYFLQVRTQREGRVLPPVKTSSICTADRAASSFRTMQISMEWPAGQCPSHLPKDTTTVGQLFKEFFHYYNSEFDFSSDIVSIRTGRRWRDQKNQHLTGQTIYNGEFSDVAPIIEDPTSPGRFLRTPMTWKTICHLRNELSRAQDLSSKVASLQELFQPYEDVSGDASTSDNLD